MPTVTEYDERTIRDVIDAVRGITPLARNRIRTYSRGAVDYNLHAREAYSYGRHFPLFRYVPATKRAPALFVINGDRWGGGGGWNRSRTGDHQETTRQAIAETGIPSIVLPFSVLDGARINIDTVRILDVREDSWETVTVERSRLEDVPRWRRTNTVRLAGPVPRYGYGPNLSVEVPVEPDPDGIYRWTEDVHRLGDALFTAVRDGRRGRYLSSFDYNERPPLYFLCEVPARGVPATVDAAIDSLAPRAVHAARLNGKTVERQGDVFFIETSLSRETLADRGAVFGRFTQWSRDAKPRAGEVTYRAPVKSVTEWTRKRETNLRRRLFTETLNGARNRAETAHIPDAAQRETNRRLWAELRERHAAELAAVAACGADPTAAESSECPICHAGIGIPCFALPADTIPARLAGRQCSGAGRYDVTYRQTRERDELQRETGKHRTAVAVPSTPNGYRRRCAKQRAQRDAAIATAQSDLRAAVFGKTPRGYGYGGRSYGMSHRAYRHWQNVRAVEQARANLVRANEPPRETRVQARDAYRQRYGQNATGAYARASDAARIRYRPATVDGTVDGTDQARARRAAVRAHLMIYGTSHTATEIARVGSAAYVRGTVRHAVDLEETRRGGPDHRPLTLPPDTWYLAVRNTVPRQNRRNRRNRARTES